MTSEKQDIKIVLDLETTGLDYKREKILEFAAVKLVNNEIVDEYETLINPQQEIRSSSIAIHGITPEMVEDKPTIEEVMPKIIEFIGDNPIVAHNAIFDYSFLNQACKDLYDRYFENHRIDTFQMYKEVFPDDPSHGLESLLTRFNVECSIKHRAMADAKNLAYVYPHLKTFYDKKRKWQLSQLDNIDYLFERYLRMQSAIQTMQSEMADLKSIFKVYFEENGKEVKATTGEILVGQTRASYSYDIDRIRESLSNTKYQEKAFKLNPGFIERLINDSDLDPALREELVTSRINMNESKSVSIIKPDKTAAQTRD